MRAYWHIPAIAAVTAVFINMFQVNWLMIVLFAWLCYLFYWKRLGALPIIVSIVSFLFFLAYTPTSEIKERTNVEAESPIPDVFTGEIVTPVTVTSKKIEFTIKEEQTNENILIIHFPSSEQLELNLQRLKHGATCIVHSSLEIPTESRNPGQFNYRNYLLSRDIKYQTRIDSSEQIACSGQSFLQPIYDLRMQLLTYSTNKLSEQSAAWLNALVLGDDSGIDEETVQLFQRWGLSHILAISGLHVGIVIGIVYFILVKLNMMTKEKAQLFMLCFLPVFTLLAGGEPSVVRAASMAFIFIIINGLKVKLSPADVLSIVFLIVILLDRYIVYHIGFQFSFIVTLALILSRQVIAKENSMLMQGLTISFISQMMILPLQFNYFSTFQPLSILLNTIVVPYFSVFVIPYMFVLLFLSPLPMLLPYLDSLFTFAHSKLLVLLGWLDQLLDQPWIIGSFSFEFSVIYYVLFFMFMICVENRKRNQAFQYGIMLTVLMGIVSLQPFLSPYGTVTMLDIGQGDAFVIELPYREGVIMIDAGAPFSFEDMEPTDRNFEQIMKPYFHSKGINKVDALILTHDDVDHMGSAPFIIEKMEVGKIMVSHYFEIPKDLARTIRDKGIQVEFIGRGDHFRVGEEMFYVLGPASNQQSSNDNSLVIYSRLGGKDWLFTGDVSKEQERELIKTYPQLNVDVLKVAHHGSNTSTDEQFIKYTLPEVGLISVGEQNAYGHPSAEVIELLESTNTTVLRTDMHGAVQFRYKHKNGTFYSYFP